MKTNVCHVVAVVVALLISGCAAFGGKRAAPVIALDRETIAIPLPEPPNPIEIVRLPEPLPLPAQLKRLPPLPMPQETPSTADTEAGIVRAIEEARVPPEREHYINAIQNWPYTEGALYQVYTSPGRVTAIVLQAGEDLVSVSAGDTARWLVGDTVGGSGAGRRVSVLVKPTRTGLSTNLVITTSRRSYLLELTATEEAWMASVAWSYPHDELLALQRQASEANATLPIEVGLTLERLRFRYAIMGDRPSWRPQRAFDDGERVYIQFPDGIAHGELPPLFVLGPQGDGQLVNYRFRSPYYIVDRLFGAAELRLGGDKAEVVRIERTDGVVRGRGS